MLRFITFLGCVLIGLVGGLAQVIPTAPNKKDKGNPPITFDAYVVSVTDSTWFETERDGKRVSIKIYGILTADRKSPLGLKASEELGKLIYGKTVRVVRQEYSAYGGIIASVSINNQDIGEFLLKRGYAAARPYLDRPNINARYKELEQQARLEGVGIWFKQKKEPAKPTR
jgi:endonuclease YncB( thermonuclease family)